MNSSTSSSRPSRKSEWKVILAVLGVFLAAELGLYLSEDRISLDVQHINQIPAIVSELKEGNDPRILFFGNSLTRASIRPDRIRSTWTTATLSEATIRLIHPDDTKVVDWVYVYRRFVQPSRPQLRLVILCFAYRHLEDGPDGNPERLGGQFAGLSLARDAFAKDVLSLSDRIRYLLGAVSRTWAYRDRVQTRILALIPGYERLAHEINQNVTRKALAKPNPPVTYNQLARFLEMLTNDGARVVFVATPMPSFYVLSEDLEAAIRRGGAELVDLRGFGPLMPADFPDHFHLSPAAAERFSTALGAALAADDYVRSALLRTVRAHVRPDPSGGAARMSAGVRP
jgi:hypothetical protein